jgi:hypothetical protein
VTLEPEIKPKPKHSARTKKAISRELAQKYADKPYAAALNLIMEETPCKKTTAHSAYKWAQKQRGATKKEKEPAAAEAPMLKIIEEKDKEPPFIQTPEPEKPEAITPEVTAPAAMPTEAEKEQLDLFRDMLRGLYDMLFGKEGLAGKYGRSKEQCERLADQQYFWLTRRYSVDDLQKFDTLLLVGAYATVVGGIAKDYLADRRKKTEGTKP